MDNVAECIRLRKEGKSVKEVMSILGISNSSVYKYTKGENILPIHVSKSLESRKEVINLINEGYGNKDIAKKLGYTCSWISNIRRKQNGYVGKQGNPTGNKTFEDKERIMRKQKDDNRVPKALIDIQMQKGLAKLKKGEKVLPNRLETGRPIDILYSDLSSVPVVKATIFSRHGGSDYDAVELWAKKYKKKSFALLNK